MYRDTGNDQICRAGFISAAGGEIKFSCFLEALVILAGAFEPQAGPAIIRVLIWLEPYIKTMHLIGMIPFHIGKGPGEFEMNAGVEPLGLAVAPSQNVELTPAFGGFDNHHAGGQPKDNNLHPHQYAQAFAQELIAPRFGNFEAKLIIQHFAGGGK